MKLLNIMLAFGGLGKNKFTGGKKKARVSGLTPRTMPHELVPATKAAAKIVTSKEIPSKLRYEEPRSTVGATQQKRVPVAEPRNRTGRQVGSKAGKSRFTNVSNDDKTIGVAPVGLKGHQKSSLISYREGQDQNSPPPPISVEYELFQSGSSKRLDEYKKMYKGSTFELDTKTLVVGGEDPTRQYQKIRPSVMAGFGRKGVVRPYASHDWYSSNVDQMTSRTSCFNRFQFGNLIEKMWESVGFTSTQIDSLLQALEKSTGGDIRIDFPLDYIECEYKYFNNNTIMPIDLQLYICTPKRDMLASHSPMSDWFNPFTSDPTFDTDKMLPDYYYEPALTCGPGRMFTVSGGVAQNQSFITHKTEILTAATEVVPECTPQRFSSKFRRNWDVMHVQPFVLEPQQELIVKFRVKMSKLVDLKQMFGYDNAGEKYESFVGLTLAPMVTFQGQDTTAVSKKLTANPGVVENNRFIEQTGIQASASELSCSMSTRARVHSKASAIRNFDASYTYGVKDVLDTMDVSSIDLFKYNALERGQQCPYWEVNDNLGYFCEKAVKPTANYELTQLTYLNIKGTPQTVPQVTEPASSIVKVLSTSANWGVLESKSISRAKLEKTGSDIQP